MAAARWNESFKYSEGVDETSATLINLNYALSYPPYAQVVPTGGQQIWVNPLGVWDPHDLGGGVRVVKCVPAHKL